MGVCRFGGWAYCDINNTAMTLDIVIYTITVVSLRRLRGSIKVLMFPQCFWTPLRHVRALSPIDVRLTTTVATSGSAVGAHATGDREISV
jgi:hypothetical protein